MTQLNGKTIFITGATAGIGKALAKQCAAQGAKLILNGRREAILNELAAALDAPTHLAAFDVRDREAVEAAITALPDTFKPVDVLVNNAGLALGLEHVPETTIENWEQMIDTNIKGLLYCTQAIIPMMQQADDGHIINIGSIAGNYPYPGGNVYCGTKSFVKQFSLCLRADLLGQNIRVTNLEPSMVDDTEFADVRFKGDHNKAKAVYEGLTPLYADDVAEAIIWSMTRPKHVNINRMEMMPTMQAPAALAVSRKKA